jgi:hypothetical protein
MANTQWMLSIPLSAVDSRRTHHLRNIASRGQRSCTKSGRDFAMSSRLASNKYHIGYPRYGAIKANLGNAPLRWRTFKPNPNVVLSSPPKNQACTITRVRFTEAD